MLIGGWNPSPTLSVHMSNHAFDPYPNRGYSARSAHGANREGRAMDGYRNMSHVYRFTKTDDLVENLHRKEVALYRARLKYLDYWQKKEIARLEYYIRQIKAELASRRDQPNLL